MLGKSILGGTQISDLPGVRPALWRPREPGGIDGTICDDDAFVKACWFIPIAGQHYPPEHPAVFQIGRDKCVEFALRDHRAGGPLKGALVVGGPLRALAASFSIWSRPLPGEW